MGYNSNQRISNNTSNLCAKGTEKGGANTIIQRGEIYYADLSHAVGCEQGGIRPVLVIQNDVGNRHSPTVIVAAITSKQFKTRLPTHINLNASQCGLRIDSVALLEQVRTLDKSRLCSAIGAVDYTTMDQIDEAIAVSFGLYLAKAG